MLTKLTVKKTIQKGKGSYLYNLWADNDSWSGTMPAKANAPQMTLEYKGRIYDVLKSCTRGMEGEKVCWTCKPASGELSKKVKELMA